MNEPIAQSTTFLTNIYPIKSGLAAFVVILGVSADPPRISQPGFEILTLRGKQGRGQGFMVGS